MADAIEKLAAALCADPEKAEAFFSGTISAERVREGYGIEQMTALLRRLSASGALGIPDRLRRRVG